MKWTGVAFAFTLLITSPAFSKNNSCDSSLLPTINISNLDRFSTLSALSLVRREGFDNFKKNIGGGLSVPIDGVPIKLIGDYDNFQLHLQNELQKYELKTSDSGRRSFYTRQLTGDQLSAWVACLKL